MDTIHNDNHPLSRLLGTPSKFLEGGILRDGRIIAIYKGTPVTAPKGIVLYEPEIKRLLGIDQKEKVKCLFEKTCGAAVYTEQDGITKFLLIKNADSGHIGFPKGHIELNETETETCIREVLEETGLKVHPDEEFRTEYEYATSEGTHKKCVYFMAHYNYIPVAIQQSEITQSWLVPFEEAMELLNYPQDREVLRAVQQRLTHI